MAEPHDLVHAETLADELRADAPRSRAGDPRLVPEAERYRLDGVIGRGGMGVVNAQVDRRIGRRVACKELRPDFAGDAELRARFLREARVQGQLEHPAIVPVYDIGERADGTAYFTMKTVRGITLAEILAGLVRGDAELAASYARHRLLAAFGRVCLAIEYAHEHGVLHRDLKPANLILGAYGEVYVLDWGLAKVLADGDAADRRYSAAAIDAAADMTRADSLLGTPGYMAPEQIADPSAVGPAADTYALGAILFELLALEPLHPRGAAALESTRAGVEARPSVRAPGCDAPPELERVIVGATALDPATRGTPRAIADAIERYLEGARDLELRRATSEQHVREALAASADPERRRHVMGHIGQALALDPTNTRAMSAMADLLANPPAVLPADLAEQVERKFHHEYRFISRIGGMIYASTFAFLGLLAWMGIRQPAVVGAFFALMAITGVISLIVARSDEPDPRLATLAMLTSSVAFAIASRFASPLLLLPASLAANATGYAVFSRPGQRLFTVVASCAAFAVPLALELLHVTSPTFELAGGGIRILPVALDLPPIATVALLAATALMSIVLASALVGYFRDRLTDAEQRLYVQAWHLRALVPDPDG